MATHGLPLHSNCTTAAATLMFSNRESMLLSHDSIRKSYTVLCWTGATAAAALGSAPAAGGSSAAGGGMSRTTIIVIAVCGTVVGLAVIIGLVAVVVVYARRHQEDLPEQETSVAMSGASGGVGH